MEVPGVARESEVIRAAPLILAPHQTASGAERSGCGDDGENAAITPNRLLRLSFISS